MPPAEIPWPMVSMAEARTIACAEGCAAVQRVDLGAGWHGAILYERTDPSPAPGPEENVFRFVRVETPTRAFDLEIGTSGTLCGGDSLFHLDNRVTSLRAADVLPGGPLELVLETAWSSAGTRGATLHVCAVRPDGDLVCAQLQPTHEPGYDPPDGTRFSDPAWVRGKAFVVSGGALWTPTDPNQPAVLYRLTGP